MAATIDQKMPGPSSVCSTNVCFRSKIGKFTSRKRFKKSVSGVILLTREGKYFFIEVEDDGEVDT